MSYVLHESEARGRVPKAHWPRDPYCHYCMVSRPNGPKILVITLEIYSLPYPRALPYPTPPHPPPPGGGGTRNIYWWGCALAHHKRGVLSAGTAQKWGSWVRAQLQKKVPTYTEHISQSTCRYRPSVSPIKAPKSVQCWLRHRPSIGPIKACKAAKDRPSIVHQHRPDTGPLSVRYWLYNVASNVQL